MFGITGVSQRLMSFLEGILKAMLFPRTNVFGVDESCDEQEQVDE
jgi:hypothetical protein